MKADFSRVTFDATEHYDAVLFQQGRVLTDAEFNEAQEIAAHRAETVAAHVIGPAGTPKYDSIGGETLPNGGFALSIDRQGVFRIGRGHYYVDGILCENERDVRYEDQPHLPQPPPLDRTAPPGTTWLVYLHVFRRERTALDDPHLRDPVLGGPDTTARSQVVWQVQLLPLGVVDVVTCDPLPKRWAALTARRGAAMAVSTPPVGPAESPCDAPPGAGFLGPENQLYRVEVHSTDEGGEGDGTREPRSGTRAATRFKWSRENGSVVARIERVGADTSGEVSGNLLGVHSTGRDSYLGFHKDDWVEYIDDYLELHNGAGELAQITGIDAQANEITLSNDVTVRFDHNPKLRRWDQRAETKTRNGAEGSSANSAAGVAMNGDDDTWLLLEHNLWVQFADAVYRPGDYWIFAARAATGSVDMPAGMQPAQGVAHHYAPLGYIQLAPEGRPTVALDCRPLFPPLTRICAEDVCYDDSRCDLNAATVQEAIEALCRREPGQGGGGGGCLCTVVLGENGIDDLQTAVDSLPETGGCICIPAGDFVQPQPVTIAGRRSITIKGCGTASAIVAEFEGPLFDISNASDIRLHGFLARCFGGGFAVLKETGLSVTGGEESGGGVHIDGCTIECRNAQAIQVFSPNRNLALTDCRVRAAQIVLFQEYALEGLTIRHNQLRAFEKIAVQFGPTRTLTHVQIEDNRIESDGNGIWFEELGGRSEITIARNQIGGAQGDDMAAIRVGNMADQALLTITGNQMGMAKEPVMRGVVIDRMTALARVVVEHNQITAIFQALLLLGGDDVERGVTVHANANILTSNEVTITAVIGSNDGSRLGQVLFSNNQVYAEGPPEKCTVDLNAARLVVMGNYVSDPEGQRPCSIELPREPEAATAIGNVSHNGVNLEGMVAQNIVVVNNARY